MFRILKGVFGGREVGVAIYENPGFPVSKPGVSQSQGNSDGDSESIFRDSTLLRFDSFLLLAAEFLAPAIL